MSDKHHSEATSGHNPEVEIIIVEILDLEDHVKKHGNKPPPKARRYVIRVDREKYTVEAPGLKGREILARAGKTPPERYLLNQKFHQGRVVPVPLDEYVDFTAPGVERFTTLPKDQTEGLVTERRQQFKLPQDDITQLAIDGHDWETLQGNWFVVHGFQLPEGFNVPTASVAIQIPGGYPMAALDMAYFYPWLQLRNGRQIPAAGTSQQIDGMNWQRWSRHYTPQHPWVPGEYNVSTHLQLVRTWLDRELTRN